LNKRSMVEVYQANSEPEAHIIKGVLESAGIDCLLQPSPVSSLQNILIPGTGVVRILVPEEDAEEARKLLEEE
jgi:hypothetical protein